MMRLPVPDSYVPAGTLVHPTGRMFAVWVSERLSRDDVDGIFAAIATSPPGAGWLFPREVFLEPLDGVKE